MGLWPHGPIFPLRTVYEEILANRATKQISVFAVNDLLAVVLGAGPLASIFARLGVRFIAARRGAIADAVAHAALNPQQKTNVYVFPEGAEGSILHRGAGGGRVPVVWRQGWLDLARSLKVQFFTRVVKNVVMEHGAHDCQKKLRQTTTKKIMFLRTPSPKL